MKVGILFAFCLHSGEEGFKVGGVKAFNRFCELDY